MATQQKYFEIHKFNKIKCQTYISLYSNMFVTKDTCCLAVVVEERDGVSNQDTVGIDGNFWTHTF